MADSKRKKEIKRKENPNGKHIARDAQPMQYYSEYPAWVFASSDQEMWAFTKEHIGDKFWTEILPKLRSLETQRQMDKAFEKAKEKYREFDEWCETHKDKPKNLFDAVIRLEEYKEISMKTFGKY